MGGRSSFPVGRFHVFHAGQAGGEACLPSRTPSAPRAPCPDHCPPPLCRTPLAQNHSCAPSMYSKILNVGGRQCLVFFARHDIQAGQELTYNYRCGARAGGCWSTWWLSNELAERVPLVARWLC